MAKLTRMCPLLALIVGVVLSVLPAEGQAQIISGKGTGIDPGNRPGTASVWVKGEADFNFDVFNVVPGLAPSGCAAMAPVHAVVNTDTIGPPFTGSDVFPFNDGAPKPILQLIPNQSLRGTGKCLYEFKGPNTGLGFDEVTLLLGPVSGTRFHFTLKYEAGTYVDPLDVPVCPDGATPVRVPLTTSFSLVNVTPPQIGTFTGIVNWLSRGRGNPQDCDYLKFP